MCQAWTYMSLAHAHPYLIYSHNVPHIHYELRGPLEHELVRSGFINFLIFLHQHIYDILISKLDIEPVQSYCKQHSKAERWFISWRWGESEGISSLACKTSHLDTTIVASTARTSQGVCNFAAYSDASQYCWCTRPASATYLDLDRWRWRVWESEKAKKANEKSFVDVEEGPEWRRIFACIIWRGIMNWWYLVCSLLSSYVISCFHM